MNKKTFFLVAMLALLVGSAKAQWFDFSNNQRASIGLNLGCVGYDFNGSGISSRLVAVVMQGDIEACCSQF